MNVIVTNNQTTGLPDLTDVFYSGSIRGITSWEQVAMLGKGNIEELIKIARSKERGLTQSIAQLMEQKELFHGKSGDDFKKLAKNYESPTDMQISVRSDSWAGDPEPTDQKSIERKAGTTTFNICGWCEHAGGGTCRYQYHITTSCGLLQNSGETRFDTPCILHDMTRQSFRAEAIRKQAEVEILKEERESVRTVIRHLQTLKASTQEKPYLMSLRPYDFFNVGDEVAVNISRFEDKKVAGEWVKGFVVFGYRHQDGCVSYQAEFPIHGNMSNHEGRGGGAGMGRPEVIDTKTLAYLHDASQSDPAFLTLWMDNIDSNLKGLDKETFIHDIIYGKFALPPSDWTLPEEGIEIKSKKDAERVLSCLDADLLKTEKEIKNWARMQLRYVHPDKHNKAQNQALTAYAERQTKAVYAARDFLIERLRNKSK